MYVTERLTEYFYYSDLPCISHKVIQQKIKSASPNPSGLISHFSVFYVRVKMLVPVVIHTKIPRLYHSISCKLFNVKWFQDSKGHVSHTCCFAAASSARCCFSSAIRSSRSHSSWYASCSTASCFASA